MPVNKELPPGIHVILGDSAGGIFRRVFGGDDRLLIDQDVLCCGPVPATSDLVAWQNVRERYWRNLVPDLALTHVSSPSNLVVNAQRLKEAELVTLWAATSLSEQLFVAFTIYLADLVGVGDGRIAVVQFEHLPAREARVMGLGELNEANLAAHPKPAPLSPEALTDYRAAWIALTSEDPALIETFKADRPNANRWLTEAMPLLLRRFPYKASGLNYWDRLLLEKVRAHAPRLVRVVGETMANDWQDPDMTGDWYLLGRLLRMADARLPKPLVVISGDSTDMSAMEVALTPFGEDVLGGSASNYPANPIDDWAGGVRISSVDNALWFNDGGRVVRQL